jgi:hypothetical protein
LSWQLRPRSRSPTSIGTDNATDELINDFDWTLGFTPRIRAAGLLPESTVEPLESIDRLFSALQARHDVSLWTDDALTKRPRVEPNQGTRSCGIAGSLRLRDSDSVIERPPSQTSRRGAGHRGVDHPVRKVSRELALPSEEAPLAGYGWSVVRRCSTVGLAVGALMLGEIGAGCGASSTRSSTRPIVSSTTTPITVRVASTNGGRPRRIVAVDRAGSIYELDSNGARLRELLHGPARGNQNDTTPRARSVALLWDGRVAYGLCCYAGMTTVRTVGDRQDLAAGVRFWGVSPDGRTLATTKAGSSIVTISDLGNGARHTIDLKNLSKSVYLSLETWTPDSRHLVLAYALRPYNRPRAGFVYTVDVETGAITGKIPIPDVTTIASTAVLADGRLLIIKRKLDSSGIPPPDAVYAIDSYGHQELLARYTPGVTQLHADPSGRHVLVMGFAGFYWLERDGSTGLLFDTSHVLYDYWWWAAW